MPSFDYSVVLSSLFAFHVAASPLALSSETNNSIATSLNCPTNFTNAVFNRNAFTHQADVLQTRWKTLNDNDVNMWIGFPPDQPAAPQDPSVVPLNMQAAEVRHVSPNATDVQLTLAALRGPNPPSHVELANEPDNTINGAQSTTLPTDVARIMKPILDAAPFPNTKIMSPALARPGNSDWWEAFNGPEGCNGCLSPGGKVDIIAGHAYILKAEDWIDYVEKFAALFPDKEIWMTEMSPATQQNEACIYSDEEMREWMTKAVTAVATRHTLKNVKKLFWTSAEWNDRHPCDTSLTFANGTATPLLQHYASLCGCE